MKNEKIEAQLSKVEKEEVVLDRKRKILEQAGIHIQQDKLKPLVGMTFKHGNMYFMVTGVPKIDWSGDELIFNPHDIPCLKLFTDGKGKAVRKEEGTVFSNAINVPDVQSYIRKEYREIPRELFDEKLREAGNDNG